MNLVTCSEQCRHQLDGICTLSGAAHPSSDAGFCCYFESRGSLSSAMPRKDI